MAAGLIGVVLIVVARMRAGEEKSEPDVLKLPRETYESRPKPRSPDVMRVIDKINARQLPYTLERIADTMDRRARHEERMADKWKELGKEFQNLPGRIRAEWEHRSDVPDVWRVPHPQCAALCKLAGAMLGKSPRVSRELPSELRSETDLIFRWLGYLKQTTPVSNVVHVYEQLPGEDQKLVVHGYLEHLAETSYGACMACAAAEF
jgi:hypothetical protein